MTTMMQKTTPRFTVNVNQVINEHITRSWWLTAWLTILTYLTIRYVLNRLAAMPVITIIVLVVWSVSVAYMLFNEARHNHTSVSLWLKNNLYSSITNIEITLLLVLAIIAAVFGLYRYAITTASFTTIPATDIRAQLTTVSDSSICFNIGELDAEADDNTLVDAQEQCFARSTYAPELSDDDLTAVTLGEEAASFCFDEMPSDPETGITCFESVAGNLSFFEVTHTYSGANWGAVGANLTTLMVFRFDRDEIWRVWASFILIIALLVPSLFVYRDSFTNKLGRRILTYIWLSTPIFLFVLLRGVDPLEGSVFSNIGSHLTIIATAVLLWFINRYVITNFPQEKGESEWIRLGRLILSIAFSVFTLWGVVSVLRIILIIFGTIQSGGEQIFVPLDPDVDWGGFLLTLIITVFAIIVSFPIGLLMALGRRSTIPGIPPWLTYPLAVGIMIWGLATSTPTLVEDARNNFELAVAYWPVFILVLAFIFQRVWQGNVVAAFSTLYIEFIRGIPLITVLFLTIILFPIFLPPEVEILGTWRVMWGFTLFSAAYLAENVRGGLQAIPKGQYEAADSLGLSTFNKYRLIILPQALRIVIPAITNQYIGLFKDTTLVAIVGLLDILGVANAISAQPQWLGVRREAYLFIALMYYIISALIAGYSARLEKRMGLGER